MEGVVPTWVSKYYYYKTSHHITVPTADVCVKLCLSTHFPKSGIWGGGLYQPGVSTTITPQHRIISLCRQWMWIKLYISTNIPKSGVWACGCSTNLLSCNFERTHSKVGILGGLLPKEAHTGLQIYRIPPCGHKSFRFGVACPVSTKKACHGSLTFRPSGSRVPK
ncbi:hypothetical protein CEXT_252161 [Caerostris extrusa]|uniref:Uncharacterized protein n=1 Tax=Caerostris extrusa TaxID=172846 RepID=A0AAV4Y4T5_CAEEX|nr:hypothetical protein CEXT_252161 [Caerostris extrusa]